MKIRHNKTQLIFSIVTFIILFCAYSFGQNTFYVDAQGGNNINNGQISSPLKTISEAFDRINPGDDIILRKGAYLESQLDWTESGTSMNPTILKAYENEEVVIDGQGVIGSIILHIQNKSNIVIEGIHFTNAIGNGSYGIKVEGSGDNIVIRNCRISNIDINNPNPGPTTNALPLKICADSPNFISNVQILNNEVFNCKTGYSEGISIAGNVDGFLIQGNYIHDMSNIGIVAAGKYQNDCKGYSRNGKIIGNSVERCVFPTDANRSASGVYVDGAENIVIERNVVSECQVGIQLGCENVGEFARNDTVRNNIVYNNISWGIGMGGTEGFVENSCIVNNTLFRNNSFYTGQHYGNFGEILLKKVRNSSILNNLAQVRFDGYNSTFMKWENPLHLSNLNINYNLFYAPSGSNTLILVKTYKINDTTTVDSLYSYNEYLNYGYDLNGKTSNPGFLNGDFNNPELHLISSSNALNSGLTLSNLGNGNEDFDGNSRSNGFIDLGAIEYYDCPQIIKTIGLGPNTHAFKATEQIKAQTIIPSGYQTKYYSEHQILLEPGFQATYGSIFTSEIKGCNEE